jgi:His-Xaa-Ser system protein HxsD
MNEDHQVTAQQGSDGVVLSFEESIYPKDAVFGAAYALLDRCFVHIDREGTKLLVRLRAKPGVSLSSDLLAGEFESEALAQSWRREIIKENQTLIQGMTSRAVAGAAGPPGLDDLLDEDLGDLGDAFDDPLGIAVSWEEKYGKGGEAAGAEAHLSVAEGSGEPAEGSLVDGKKSEGRE